jgi:hypothetical protein
MQSRSYFTGIALMLSASLYGAETFVPEPASGPPVITAAYPLEAQADVLIGKLKVVGTGKVRFFAHVNQGRLYLKAVGSDGAPIGRAESVVGLGDTPLYVRSSKGLYKILVHWKQ